MRTRWVIPLVILVSIAASSVASSVARADLNAEIKSILRDKYFNRAEVGIAIARLGASPDQMKVVYRFDSDIPLIPASNLKLLTTAAFLDQFGADFKFKTPLLLKDGDAILVGDGDPTLGDAELLRKLGWDVTTVFLAWADELKKRGVTGVRNLLVDDSVFDEQFVHPNWLARYAHLRYSAQVAGVNLNANCVDFLLQKTSPGAFVNYTMNPNTRYVTVKNECVSGGDDNIVGLTHPPGKNDITIRGQLRSTLVEPVSIPINDPPMFAATVLSETLTRSGVAVSGSVSRDRTARQRYIADPAGWSVAAVLETRLSTVLERANKDSMNLYADALCKRLGRQVSGESGSWENGRAAMGAFLKRIGVAEGQFTLDDGCGLSRENAVSADALMKVLAHSFHGQSRQIWLDSLAVAGADGTFEKRFKGDLRGRVFGKSGYVSGVSAISGYLKTRDDQWYAFSILMNNLPEGTNNTAKAMQERIIAAVDESATH